MALPIPEEMKTANFNRGFFDYCGNNVKFFQSIIIYSVVTECYD